MNKHIDQCLYQAGLTAQGCWDELGTYEQEAIERFAELIVEECVAQCWTVSAIEHKGYVISECSKRIRKHFGVDDMTR